MENLESTTTMSFMAIMHEVGDMWNDGWSTQMSWTRTPLQNF